MRLSLLITIGLVLSFATTNSQVRKQTTDSKIDKVTIFLKGAQVQRAARTNISAGKSELVFSNISPRIDKQSIQVKADGKLTVLSVTHQMNILKEQDVQDEIKQIEQQRQSIIEKIEQEKNMLTVYEQEEVMLLKNQDIKGDQALLKATDLKDAMDFQRQRLIEVYSKKTEYKRTIKKLETDLDKFNRQLIALNQKKDLSTSEIIVTVSAKETTSTNFVLTYLVNNAGWYPTYDIRVKDINSPIDLQTKANVFQNSGEDWKEVKLMLSTGDPSLNNVKPDLSPWHLRYLTYESSMRDKDTKLNEVVVVGYGSKAKQLIKRQQDDESIETTITYQPTTTIYEIAEPYSVPNDGKIYTADMDSYEVTALYEYYAAPKIEAEAFLTAKVVDWQDLNLLPGEANLFFEGTFLGKTLMDVTNAGDTLNISLGNDKGVIVKRTLVKGTGQKKFLGSNKTDTRQYEIPVRNNKQQPINIIIEDQFPISTNKEIEIDNKEYPGAKLDDQTQKLTWQPKLEPKGETKLNFRYSVKYPKERVVNLD